MTSAGQCVLYLFVSTAPLAAVPDAAPGPQDPSVHGRGGLLGLVRKIIAYGRELVDTLRQQNTAAPPVELAHRFGTFNLALIIARIARGLAIAAGLEERLFRGPLTQERPRPTGPAASPRAARSQTRRPPAPSRSDEDAALLLRLPSAEEIARRIRGRRAGAVIVEICGDLGIDASHPLWREIQRAIIQYDGSLARMLTIWMSRFPALLACAPRMAMPPSSEWNGPPAATTGPP